MKPESEPDFQHLFESAPGLYLVLDPALMIVAVSDAYLKATMTDRKNILHRHLFDVFPDNPDDNTATGSANLKASLDFVLQQQTHHQMANQKYDIRRPDGSFEERYWSPVNTPVLDENKRVTYIIHQVEDITELIKLQQMEVRHRKNFEEKLREMNVQLREEVRVKTAELMGIFDRITDGFIALDKNYCYIYANKKIGEITHRDPASLIGKNVWEEFPEAVGSSTYKAFHTALNEQRYVSNIDYFESLDIWQENHIYPSHMGLSVFIRDITERKKAEQKLQQSNDDLRELATHLQNVREEEQKRIAREVHDELGQQITGLKMDVSWIKRKISGRSDANVLNNKLEQMTLLLDNSVQTVRKISSELRPAILDDLGIIDALEWQGAEFEKRFGIPLQFKNSALNLQVPSGVATGLFRVYQESLTNIARHAHAKKVEASLKLENKHLTLTVSDDGVGFDMTSDKKSLGLLGMRERVLMMGGLLDIVSIPGKGTTVIVTVPI